MAADITRDVSLAEVDKEHREPVGAALDLVSRVVRAPAGAAEMGAAGGGGSAPLARLPLGDPSQRQSHQGLIISKMFRPDGMTF
jgi:hypothetical protein